MSGILDLPSLLHALFAPSVLSLLPLCPPCSLHAPLHVCARMSISLILSAGKARSWVLSGLHVVLKELLNPNKLSKVLAGSVCSSPPLLPPACVSSVPVAGRLQHEGHIQLPAAFPSQLQCWGPGQWHHQVDGMAGQGLIGSGHCRVANACPAQGNSLEEQEYHVFGTLFLALCSRTWKCGWNYRRGMYLWPCSKSLG